jgi:type I restriction enzyme, S subunit
MALVDHLERRQQEKDKVAEAFAKASVAAITGAKIEENEKMKAPKTELISMVKAGKKTSLSADAPLAAILNKHKGVLSAKALWQQSGLTIDAFYQQLKNELAQGWIALPQEAEMKILEEA